jgi:hypothetical protein
MSANFPPTSSTYEVLIYEYCRKFIRNPVLILILLFGDLFLHHVAVSSVVHVLEVLSPASMFLDHDDDGSMCF